MFEVSLVLRLPWLLQSIYQSNLDFLGWKQSGRCTDYSVLLDNSVFPDKFSVRGSQDC